MTDKQIIIDGVDVSECPYYCGHDICKNTCHYFCTPCEWVEIKNCTYKQFKQAEQTVEECHKYQVVLEDKLTDKEQECEELKEQLQKYRSAFEEIREDMEQDTTCESRECGCDDYAECLNCIKETILNKISECEGNDEQS